MVHKVPKDAKIGAGKTFISKRAYLEYCADFQAHNNPAAYTTIEPTSFIGRKMLGKTSYQNNKYLKGKNRPARWS